MAVGKPDLRRLSVGLLDWMRLNRPDCGPSKDDVDRVRESKSVLLVLLRVLSSIVMKLGMTRAELDSIVAKSSEPETSGPMTIASLAEPDDTAKSAKIERGVLDAYGVMTDIDLAMATRKTPDWFNTMWSDVLKRTAQGGSPTERELWIATSILEKCQ